MKEFDLGELEFKAEDLTDDFLLRALADFGSIPEQKLRFLRMLFTGEVNRRLGEKLEKAPEVEAFISDHHKRELWTDFPKLNGHKRARLVCVEEIEK